MKFVLRAALVLLWAWAGTALAQSPDPRVAWHTADSANFRIHYRAAQRAQAEAVARAAERVYPRVTEALRWRLRERTEIVVITETDLANGYMTPLPFNLIGLMLAPPDEGELLENSAWLDLLLVHELTHAVHLDQVRGLPRGGQRIFGNMPLFIPNLFNPGWALEGLAVQVESTQTNTLAANGAWSGQGRLRSPTYEAWLRAQRERGFISLRELNANGRALPLAKQYLYGAYFYDFLARRYGADMPRDWVWRYSGNLVPRLHSNPVTLTGKPLDVLWEEFLIDLAAQVDAGAVAIRRQAEATGQRLTVPMFQIPSVAMQADGALLAVLNDGLGRPRLTRFTADGRRSVLAAVNAAARVTTAADGRVLVAQPDLCDPWTLGYDLYALRDGELHQLTHCARLRRAVYAGTGERAGIVALQHEAGATRLVWLDAQGRQPLLLYAPPPGVVLTDLAARADRVSVVAHRGAVMAAHGGEQRDASSKEMDASVQEPADLRGSGRADTGADWRILQFDLSRPQAPPRTLLRSARPIHGLAQDHEVSQDGLTMILAEDGVHNVWRLDAQGLQRLSHAYTGVTAQTGRAADGSLGLVVVAPGGYELRRMAQSVPLQTLQTRALAPAKDAKANKDEGEGGDGWPWTERADATAAGATAQTSAGNAAATAITPVAEPSAGFDDTPHSADAGSNQAALGASRPYAAWRSMYPRWWFPTLVSDHGLFTMGAQTSGADALGWHQYAATLAVETTQQEPVGSLEYLYRGQHHLALSRSVRARAWTGGSSDPETTAYRRDTQAQWLSVAQWPTLERRLTLGLGAALERSDWVEVDDASEQRLEDRRLAAALLDYDSQGLNWRSEGVNRGVNVGLLYETHEPFERGGDRGGNLLQGQDLNGAVLRADLRGFVPLGRTVLGLRYTEARAQGRTEPFQLGGATDQNLQLGIALGNRELALRGYQGDEPELLGANARVASIEWRFPLADVDRHFMVPPVGLNRLSAAVFHDIGGAWGRDEDAPARYWRGVGVELLGELKLLYVLGLQLRLGIARGLDGPQETHAYMTVGRAF
jgi:hypothetical protein